MNRSNFDTYEMKTTLLSLLFAFTASLLFAQQSSTELPSYHPVSPNAASLGKYGLYPVNKNLGTPEVSIPIYTLTENDLTVPLSLSYNMSGIRLNELASWVGLGWSLNAGGAIVRNTKGLPDLNFLSTIPNLENTEFTQSYWDYLVGAADGYRDTQPDQYVIRALGMSGSFYFDRNNIGEVVFEDASQIKVTTVSAEEIHVISPDGQLLVFGNDSNNNLAIERTDSNLSNLYLSGPEGFISTWYLTEIYSKDRQQKISFEYKEYVDPYGGTMNEDYAIPVSESIRVDAQFLPTDEAWRTHINIGSPELSKMSKKYLEKIVFENGYIEFESSMGRDDLEDDYKLDAIKVYAYDKNDIGQLVDQYHFTYDYFVRSGGTFSRGYETSPLFFDPTRQEKSMEKSMKLTSLYRGPLPSSDAVHTFTYNENTPLPRRCTTAQDSWGYPNTNGGTLLPETMAQVQGIASPATYFVGDGDRSPDEQKMKAAVLKKITYPTGGSTVFDMEANRVSANEQTYVRNSARAYAYGEECNGDPSDSGDITFNIPEGSVNIRLMISMGAVEGQASGINSSVSLDGKYFYRPVPNSSGGAPDSSDGLELTIDLFFGYNLGTPFNPVSFTPGTHVLRAHEIGLGGSRGAIPCSYSSITISWDEPAGVQEVQRLVGGLRVKSISNYDGKSPIPASVKKFEYASPNLIHPERNRGYIRRVFSFNDNRSRLFSQVSTIPNYNNNLGGEPIIEYGKVTEYDYSFLDDDNNPLTPQDNGKTVSFYQNIQSTRTLSSVLGGVPFQHPQFSFNFPYITDRWPSGEWNIVTKGLINTAIFSGYQEFSFYESTSWKRGKLRREETYKRDGENYILVKEVDNEYENLKSIGLPYNFVYRPIESDSGSWLPQADPYNQEVDFNSIMFAYVLGGTEIGKRALTKSTVKQYDDNGNNPLTTITDYHYDNLEHLMVTRTETLNSRGEQMSTKTFYPDDIATNSALGTPNLTSSQMTAIDRLKKNNLHRITEPVQVETTINGKTSIQRTTYKDWYSYMDPNFYLVLPDSVNTLKGTLSAQNPWQKRTVYKNYDPNGNPREIAKIDGPSVCYIWGYHKKYPIAKIENATYNEINTNFNISNLQSLSDLDSDNTIGNSGDEGALRTALANLRAAFPDAMVTTYTYDPLIGVTSMTDPRGYTIYYTYDEFNRLAEVKDADGNLVTDYEYHYKGQTN